MPKADVESNANKPILVELQKLRGSAQNRGTPETEVFRYFELSVLGTVVYRERSCSLPTTA